MNFTNFFEPVRIGCSLNILRTATRIQNYSNFILNTQNINTDNINTDNINIESESDEEDDRLCSICQQNYNSNDILRIITHCSHYYHQHCLDQWLENNTKCPECQYDLRETRPIATSTPNPIINNNIPSDIPDLINDTPNPITSNQSPESILTFLLSYSQQPNQQPNQPTPISLRNQRLNSFFQDILNDDPPEINERVIDVEYYMNSPFYRQLSLQPQPIQPPPEQPRQQPLPPQRQQPLPPQRQQPPPPQRQQPPPPLQQPPPPLQQPPPPQQPRQQLPNQLNIPVRQSSVFQNLYNFNTSPTNPIIIPQPRTNINQSTNPIIRPIITPQQTNIESGILINDILEQYNSLTRLQSQLERILNLRTEELRNRQSQIQSPIQSPILRTNQDETDSTSTNNSIDINFDREIQLLKEKVKTLEKNEKVNKIKLRKLNIENQNNNEKIKNIEIHINSITIELKELKDELQEELKEELKDELHE